MSAASAPRPAAGRGLMGLLALIVFMSASTVHYQSPMLARFAVEFGATPAAVGWIPTLAFAGFLAGIVLLVPLGDRFDKRHLIVAHLAALVVAVLAMAAAPSLAWLCGASFAIGAAASLSQYVVPLAVEIAGPKGAGAAVGTVMSGLFLGILFGRLAGGFVAATLGWRWMYLAAAASLVLLLVIARTRLPASAPRVAHRYGALLRSLATLYREAGLLRRASAVQFLLALGYGGFWATVAAMLAAAHGYGPGIAGLLGIPGAAGVLVARPAGRMLDRRGAAPVVTTGIVVFALAFIVLGFAAASIVALVAGAALLDCGLRAAMVANQTVATSVDAHARSRLNTIFQAHLWGGNAVGAALAGVLYTHLGWRAVCYTIVAAAVVALVVQRTAPRA